MSDRQDRFGGMCNHLREAAIPYEQSIDQPQTQFPFEAWDLIEHKRVIVIGWYDENNVQLASGHIVRPDSVTTAFPDWLINAERQLADARDERDTLNDARYAGCQ